MDKLQLFIDTVSDRIETPEEMDNYNTEVDQLEIILADKKIKEYILPPSEKMLKIIAQNTNGYVVLYDDQLIKFGPVIHRLIINEIFIGLLGINNLDSRHFAKVLSANPISKCPQFAHSKLCSYIEYEYVPGITLSSYLEIYDLFILKRILLELFQALHYANKKIGFTHYDLHLGNVIITDDKTPVMIDYGLSHMVYKGKDYGVVLEDGKVYNKELWFHDIVKVLMIIYAFTNKQIVIEKYCNAALKSLQYRQYKEADSFIQKIIKANAKLNDSIQPFILKLIGFFIDDFNVDIYKNYMKYNAFYTPTKVMIENADKYNFDEFINLATEILE